MSRLEISLLGSPRVLIDGHLINTRIDKAIGILATLALCGPSLTRDSLIAYLWTDSGISKAHGALRTALWRLKSLGLDPWLEIERDQITLLINRDFWLDVIEFNQFVEQTRNHNHPSNSLCQDCLQHLTQAIDLYRGEFMSGYNLRNAAGFDEWRTHYNQVLNNHYLNALETLVSGLYKLSNYEQAIQIGRRWLAVDPYNDSAHLLFLKIYASYGQLTNAIAHYRNYKRLIEKNLKIPPTQELTNFYQHLLLGRNPKKTSLPRLDTPIILQIDIDQVENLWAVHNAKMGEVLNQLSNLLNKQIQLFGGRIIGQSEDHTTLIFERGQPLYFAIGLFRTVGLASWQIPGRLALRMALSTLPTYQPNSPETAAAIHVSQQLLKAASGYQILLTSTVIPEIELPIGARTNDLGSYAIPGETNPVLVYEVIHPHLPIRDHSYLVTLNKAPTNLPIQTTRFIGRENELIKLDELINQPECRLISIIGPGGVGKTRLAIQALLQIRTGFPDGIFYIPLIGHTEQNTICGPISKILKITPNQQGELSEHLINYLTGKRMLLLLDNLEHLQQSTHCIMKLMEGATGVKLIVTSQARLNLYQEAIVELRGLPYPIQPGISDLELYGAMKLFVQNAQRVLPGYTLRSMDIPAVHKICKLVDGLPLGIELASSWVRAISCTEIAESIQENLDFLRTTSPDVPLRHRSLRAVFEHSWSGISEESRRILGRLSIFHDGFTQQAAQPFHAVPIMLASFIDKSLLTRQSNGRYYIQETLRVYIEEKYRQDSQEYLASIKIYCEYYANYFATIGQAISSKSGPAIIEEIRTEYYNIRQALTWAIDQQYWEILHLTLTQLFPYLGMTANFREMCELAKRYRERLVELVGINLPDLFYTLLMWEGWATFRLGFISDGIDKLQSSLEHAQNNSLTGFEMTNLMLVAEAHRRIGNYNEAFCEIQRCVELLEKNNALVNPQSSGVWGFVWVVYATILIDLRQYENARQIINEKLGNSDLSISYYGMIEFLNLKSRLAIIDNEYEESRQLLLQAHEIAKVFNDWREIAQILYNLSKLDLPIGNIQQAVDHVRQALQISREMGDLHLEAICNISLGFIHLTSFQQPSTAIQYYLQSLKIFKELSNQIGIFYALRDIGRAYIMNDDLDKAKTSLIEAAEIGSHCEQTGLVFQLLPVVAHYYAHTNRLACAVQLSKMTLSQPGIDPDLLKEARGIITDLEDKVSDQEALLPLGGNHNQVTFEYLLSELSDIPFQINKS